jgi:hypothetical protein
MKGSTIKYLNNKITAIGSNIPSVIKSSVWVIISKNMAQVNNIKLSDKF